jgi:hypothetical protein
VSLRIRFAGPLLAGLFVLTFAPATARAGIPIIYDSEETLSFVTNLPENHPFLATHPGSAVGYKYYRFHVYWCDLWTSSGEYCVYSGDEFEPLGNDPAEAARKLGMPEASLHRPIFYLFPFGWVLIGGFVLVSTVGGAIKKWNSPMERAERLLKQPLYQEAWQLASVGPAGFDKGVSFLTGRGLTQEKAEENMQLIFSYHAAMAQLTPPAAPSETATPPSESPADL